MISIKCFFSVLAWESIFGDKKIDSRLFEAMFKESQVEWFLTDRFKHNEYMELHKSVKDFCKTKMFDKIRFVSKQLCFKFDVDQAIMCYDGLNISVLNKLLLTFGTDKLLIKGDGWDIDYGMSVGHYQKLIIRVSLENVDLLEQKYKEMRDLKKYQALVV